jgi:hypothetical protein
VLETTPDYILHGDKKEPPRHGLVDLPKVEAVEVFEEPDFTIPPENEIVRNPNVMFSTEIAALTKKQHAHVLRDIDEIIEQLNQNPDLDFACNSTSYTGSNGQKYKCYELDYEATMIVMTGYDVVARAKVIKRWLELEQQAKSAPPPTVDLLLPEVSILETFRN